MTSAETFTGSRAA